MVSRFVTMLILMAVVAISSPPKANAATTTLYATGDIGISSGGGTLTTGLSGFQNADNNGATIRRMLIQWDTSSIPAGSTIDSAILRIGGTDNPFGKSYSVYKLTESWVEGNGGSNGSAVPGTGSTYGATWFYRNVADANTAWIANGGTNGGTFDPAATLTFTAGSGQSSHYNSAVYSTNYPITYKMNFDIAPIVQAWVNDATKNFGVAVGSNEATYARMAMWGREYNLDVGNGANIGPVPADPSGYAQGVPWASPALLISYTASVPEPSTVGLLAAAGGLAGCRWYRRRR